MLPKVKTALTKRLKPLRVVESAGLTRTSPETEGESPSAERRSDPPPLHAVPDSSEETPRPVARNGVIEFFGRLRASRFPVFKWFAVKAYSMANKAYRSGDRKKKGVLVDRNFE